MTTTYNGYGETYGQQAQPQQFYPAFDQAAPAGQPDFYAQPQQPQFAPAQAAWSQPYSQQYYPQAPQGGFRPQPGNKNKIIAIVAGIMLLLGGGTVGLILALSGPDTPTPAAPQVPVNAPQNPQVPSNYPQIPQVPTNGPVAPTNGPVAPTNGPVEPTNGPVEPTNGPVEPTNGPVSGPGQAEAEQVAGSFVQAIKSSDFATAETFICSAKSQGFADRFAAAAAQLDLASMSVSTVTVSGETGQLVLQYRMAGDSQMKTEPLDMLVEQGTWKVCT